MLYSVEERQRGHSQARHMTFPRGVLGDSEGVVMYLLEGRRVVVLQQRFLGIEAVTLFAPDCHRLFALLIRTVPKALSSGDDALCSSDVSSIQQELSDVRQPL